MGFSLADPTQKEAFYITLISAFAAAVFWALSLYEEHHQRSVHASVISFSLSSFIDLFSTAFVLWRFCSRDALAQTVENSQAEARAAVAVSLALLALAVVDTSFAVGDLAGEVKPTRSELYNMVLLSLPSQAVYLTVGMLQLQIGCRLRSNSLTKDGVVTIFSAATGMAQLTGAQIDMVGGTRKEWFYDPLLTIGVACAMFVYGIYALNEETRLGATWWRFSFWYSGRSGKLPPDVEGAKASGAAEAKPPASDLRESQPLKK